MCGRPRFYHSGIEAKKCLSKGENKRERVRRLSWLRIRKAGEIIREFRMCTKIRVAEALEEEGIPTSHWIMDKITPNILELNPDIEYNKKLKQFYVYTIVDEDSFSLSKNGESTSNEANRAETGGFQSRLN